MDQGPTVAGRQLDSVIAIGQALGMTTVAEGIEREDQAKEEVVRSGDGDGQHNLVPDGPAAGQYALYTQYWWYTGTQCDRARVATLAREVRLRTRPEP